MEFIINTEQMDTEDFSEASIYLDACFILVIYIKQIEQDLLMLLDVSLTSGLDIVWF